jgi:hypothetical protein
MDTPYTAQRTALHVTRRDLLKAGLAAAITVSAWSVCGPTLLWGEEAGPPKRGASSACADGIPCTSIRI